MKPRGRYGSTLVYSHNFQQLAAEAGEGHHISDVTAIHLVLTALERTRMFTDACANWHKRAPATHTLANFKLAMDHAWKERNHRVKAKDVSYHDALSTSIQALSAGKENCPPAAKAKLAATVDSVPMFYCWSHDLGFALHCTV